MIARVYKNGDKKFAASFGKVYRIDENGKAYLMKDYKFHKFMIDTFIGSLTFGKKGLLKTFEFIALDIFED